MGDDSVVLKIVTLVFGAVGIVMGVLLLFLPWFNFGSFTNGLNYIFLGLILFGLALFNIAPWDEAEIFKNYLGKAILSFFGAVYTMGNYVWNWIAAICWGAFGITFIILHFINAPNFEPWIGCGGGGGGGQPKTNDNV